MSRLSDLEDGPPLTQLVLPIVAASDTSRQKKPKKALRAATPATPLNIWNWLVILYTWSDEKVFMTTTGTYLEGCAFRDDHLASGKYEKAWLIRQV